MCVNDILCDLYEESEEEEKRRWKHQEEKREEKLFHDFISNLLGLEEELPF